MSLERNARPLGFSDRVEGGAAKVGSAMANPTSQLPWDTVVIPAGFGRMAVEFTMDTGERYRIDGDALQAWGMNVPLTGTADRSLTMGRLVSGTTLIIGHTEQGERRHVVFEETGDATYKAGQTAWLGNPIRAVTGKVMETNERFMVSAEESAKVRTVGERWRLTGVVDLKIQIDAIVIPPATQP